MDKQREMFEAWYLDYCKPGTGDWFARDFFNADEYVMSHTQTAWDAWQDAIAAQWQPIETAPQDGTSVIAYRSGKHGIHIEAMFFADGYWYCSLDGDCPSQQPTHWMPLPPEPTK